jgi:hypothetical protein
MAALATVLSHLTIDTAPLPFGGEGGPRRRFHQPERVG